MAQQSQLVLCLLVCDRRWVMQINSQPLEGWDNNNGETCLSGQKVKVAKRSTANPAQLIMWINEVLLD